MDNLFLSCFIILNAGNVQNHHIFFPNFSYLVNGNMWDAPHKLVQQLKSEKFCSTAIKSGDVWLHLVQLIWGLRKTRSWNGCHTLGKSRQISSKTRMRSLMICLQLETESTLSIWSSPRTCHNSSPMHGKRVRRSPKQSVELSPFELSK